MNTATIIALVVAAVVAVVVGIFVPKARVVAFGIAAALLGAVGFDRLGLAMRARVAREEQFLATKKKLKATRIGRVDAANEVQVELDVAREDERGLRVVADNDRDRIRNRPNKPGNIGS